MSGGPGPAGGPHGTSAARALLTSSAQNIDHRRGSEASSAGGASPSHQPLAAAERREKDKQQPKDPFREYDLNNFASESVFFFHQIRILTILHLLLYLSSFSQTFPRFFPLFRIFRSFLKF
jgi:hypothetical protein